MLSSQLCHAAPCNKTMLLHNAAAHLCSAVNFMASCICAQYYTVTQHSLACCYQEVQQRAFQPALEFLPGSSSCCRCGWARPASAAPARVHAAGAGAGAQQLDALGSRRRQRCRGGADAVSERCRRFSSCSVNAAGDELLLCSHQDLCCAWSAPRIAYAVCAARTHI